VKEQETKKSSLRDNLIIGGIAFVVGISVVYACWAAFFEKDSRSKAYQANEKPQPSDDELSLGDNAAFVDIEKQAPAIELNEVEARE